MYFIFGRWSMLECAIVFHCADSLLLWRDWLWAAVLGRALLTPVPLVGKEGFVDGKVLHVGLQDVHDIRLTGNHHQLGEKNMQDYRSQFHLKFITYYTY